MFILDWLPDFVFQLMLVVGIGAAITTTFFGRLIPMAYELLVKIVMVVCLALGLVWTGYNYKADEFAKEIAEARIEIAKLEADASAITTQVVTEYVDRIKIVKEKGEVIEKQVHIYVPAESDAKCVIDSGFVRGHNSAAGKVSGAPSNSDGSPSKSN
jgi:hypothetical protein